MKSYEPFSSAATTHNPYYRHSKSRKGLGASTTDRFYVLVGTFVVFLLFLGYQNVRNVTPRIDQQAEAAAALLEDKQRPTLRATHEKMETQQKQALSTSPLHFKIMTFNLRFAGTGDGLNGWQYRKEHVADIINRYHPAVMGTQEGLKTQLAELEHPYERFGVEREQNGEFEQLFYDTEVLERLDSGDFWLSEEPDTPGTKGWDAACVRSVTWGKFRLRATRQVLFIFNTQLDHVGDQSREKSSKLLWERMKRIAGDAPLFLMGDFNTYRHTSTYSFFTSQKDGPKLREAWPEAAKQIGDVSFTYHGWAGVHNDGEKTAIRAANHIDWIFYRPEMKVLTTEVITEDRNGRYPSDHYPIQAEVLFPSPAELPPPAELL
uniref:Endonuclease/exonuclease/phosphatase domain-containing protein n=1 Tax=Hyaloperonospora arabidopsidis (strain Emoy2) TaxID=559515 RepID=M4B5D5_HYAAE